MMPEATIEHGRKLFQSATNLRKSAPDLDALLESLWEEVQDEKYFGDVVDLGDEDGGGAKEWIASAYVFNAGIWPDTQKKDRGRKKNKTPSGTISFLVRLCNRMDVDEDLPDWPWLNQACLIVGWHPKENHEDTWEIENFEVVDDNRKAIRHAGDGLWAWHETEADEDYAYFYALPIFALTGEKTARQFILQPLKTLFDAADPKSIAKQTLRDVPVLLPTS